MSDTMTLSSATPSVALTGVINASGSIGIYQVNTGGGPMPETIYAAVFGPSTTHFSIQNIGTVVSYALSEFDVGIALGESGTVTNQGTIAACTDIAIFGTKGTSAVQNVGELYASIGVAVFTEMTTKVINDGNIHGRQTGIILRGGGTVTNDAAARITSQDTGVEISKGGLVNNAGTIYGDNLGIVFDQGGTLIESGSIGSGATYAVYFHSGYAATSRLILSPTAHVTGTIEMNGGAVNFAADGKKIGTFAPEDLQILNAGSITLDSHAIWDISGTFTNGTAGILVNDGTIKESALDLIDFNGPITGTGVIDLSKQVLTFNDTVASSQKISFTGTGETLALSDPKAFHAKIEHFKSGDTIDLTGVSLAAITATHFVHSVLTLDEAGTKLEFTFANPGTFGTDTFALTADGPGTFITLAPPAALLPVTHPATITPLASFA